MSIKSLFLPIKSLFLPIKPLFLPIPPYSYLFLPIPTYLTPYFHQYVSSEAARKRMQVYET